MAWQAVLAWFGSFLFSSVCFVALLTVFGYQDTTQDELPLWFLALAQVPLWVGLVGSTLFISRQFGTGDVRRDYGFRAKPIDAAVGLPLGIAAQLVFVPLLYRYLLPFIDSERVTEPAKQLTEKATGAGLLLLAVLVVVGAPLIEELFFRGLLLRALQGRYTNLLALGVSSVLFGLAHFQLVQFPALVMFGLLAGFLAQRTGRLGPSIFAHAGFNLATVLVLTVELSR